MFFRKLRLLLLVVVIDAFQEAEAVFRKLLLVVVIDVFRKLRLLLLVVVIDVFQEAEAAVILVVQEAEATVTSCCDRCFSGS